MEDKIERMDLDKEDGVVECVEIWDENKLIHLISLFLSFSKVKFFRLAYFGLVIFKKLKNIKKFKFHIF